MFTPSVLSQPQNTPPIALEAYQTAKASVGWRKHQYDILLASGNDCLDLLQRMTTNNVLGLQGNDDGGNGIQNILLTDKARIIDVFTILPRGKDILLLLSDGMAIKVSEWLDKYTFIDDIQTKNVTPNYASYLIFGVKALQLLEELSEAKLSELRTASWIKASIGEIPECIIVKQPPLCEFCYSVVVPSALASNFEKIMQSLNGVATIDDETFETLRIEAAWGKLGAEWTDGHNPLEAGLVGLVDFKKGCYIGQEVIARLDTYNKVKVRLMGFTAETTIPLHGHFFDETEDGKFTDIGVISSTTYSPELGKYIALGYIRSQFANPDAQVLVKATKDDGSEHHQMLEIVKLPFVM